MDIDLTFLGTSQAIPTEKRNHTSILLSYKSENILIDCGEGTQRQFRKLHINPCKLTKILITHWHGDHVLGLPGLFQTLALNNYNRTLHIYLPKSTKHHIELMFKLFVFQGKIKYEIHECESGKIFENEDFIIETEKMDNGTPCNAYSFVEKDKLSINKTKLRTLKIKREDSAKIKQLTLGKNINVNGKIVSYKNITYIQKGKKITFILDTKLNKNIEKISKNSDLLITESTYSKSEEALALEYKHLTSEQAAKIAKKSNSKKLALTHISQRYENNEKLILNEAKKIFKNTILAEDLMMVKV